MFFSIGVLLKDIENRDLFIIKRQVLVLCARNVPERKTVLALGKRDVKNIFVWILIYERLFWFAPVTKEWRIVLILGVRKCLSIRDLLIWCLGLQFTWILFELFEESHVSVCCFSLWWQGFPVFMQKFSKSSFFGFFCCFEASFTRFSWEGNQYFAMTF